MRLVRRSGRLQAGKRFVDKNQKVRREVFARTDSHARHSRFVRPSARPAIPSRGFCGGNRSHGRKCREEAARKELRHHRRKRRQRRKFGNGERRKRGDDFVSKWRKSENFSRAKKKYRARARKNIF